MMDGLRTGLSVLAGYDEQIEDRSLEVNNNRAYDLLAKLPAITVNSYRVLNKQKVVHPHQDLSYSANFLYMITGEVPSEQEAEILDRKSTRLNSSHVARSYAVFLL